MRSFWHLAGAPVLAHCIECKKSMFSLRYLLFFLPLLQRLLVPLFVGSRSITSFHSPVHEGSVDVDEIDEDLKVEVSLDADFSLVATK